MGMDTIKLLGEREMGYWGFEEGKMMERGRLESGDGLF